MLYVGASFEYMPIPTIQLTDHMKLKKKEDHSVEVSVLLRRGNKIITECRKGHTMERGGEGKKEGQDQV